MDLVWKPPARSKDDARQSCLSHSKNRGREDLRRQGSPKYSGFKFIQGRPKRKRKPKQLRQDVMHLKQTIDLNLLSTELSTGFHMATPSPPPVTSGIHEEAFNPVMYTEDIIEAVDRGLDVTPSDHTSSILTMTTELREPDDSSMAFNTSGATRLHDSNSALANFASSGVDLVWPIFPEEISSDFSATKDVQTTIDHSLDFREHDSGARTPHTSNLSEGFSFVSNIQYDDLAHKYRDVLTMYDEEFCVVPLTWDCRTNPFRAQMENIKKFPFLLHAILALSSQHLAKKNNDPSLVIEMYKHRSTALHLFSESLNYSSIVPLLDTILIMVNLETTQTATSTWGVHLSGAQSLLERDGAVERYGGNPHLQAQLAMIIWWDVTIAFIARKEPRLPATYLDMLAEQEKGDNWSFFGLNGCPVEFVKAMARLAKLAAIYMKTTRMEWTIFNRLPVDAVIEQIKNYVNEEAVDINNTVHLERDLDARQNRFHCIEAWRHAILLYAYRVFVPKQDHSKLRLISHLSRLILDSVRCIPKTDVLQKQLLLPLFLAGAEVIDETTRHFILEYCTHWSNTSRFYHFESAGVLLKAIWKDASISTRDEHWWGVKLRSEACTQSEGNVQPMVSELLFG